MDPKQRLVQIEQEKRQWQKYYEDEERRIEEEYVRREAEIDEELKEGTKILYAQGSQGNFLYEKILDRPGIEPVTLSMVMLNTRAFTASAIWALDCITYKAERVSRL
ncbi:hypothetical protein RP20_CCG012314 [Aedes albopictus]|nr:hypothetical protein RP20_CCG012314 [Aedes albopictus]